MSAALIQLRTKLANSAELQQFFQDHYQRDARHYIGYKRAPSANDYPFICYISKSVIRKKGVVAIINMSLVVGVNDPVITDNIFNGVISLDAVEQLIIDALMPFRLNKNYVVSPVEIRTITDLTMRHPFHEREIQLTILRR